MNRRLFINTFILTAVGSAVVPIAYSKYKDSTDNSTTEVKKTKRFVELLQIPLFLDKKFPDNSAKKQWTVIRAYGKLLASINSDWTVGTKLEKAYSVNAYGLNGEIIKQLQTTYTEWFDEDYLSSRNQDLLLLRYLDDLGIIDLLITELTLDNEKPVVKKNQFLKAMSVSSYNSLFLKQTDQIQKPYEFYNTLLTL